MGIHSFQFQPGVDVARYVLKRNAFARSRPQTWAIIQNALPNGRVNLKIRPVRHAAVFLRGALRLFFGVRQAAAASATSH